MNAADRPTGEVPLAPRHGLPDRLHAEEFRLAAACLRKNAIPMPGGDVAHLAALMAVLDYGVSVLAEGPRARAAHAGFGADVSTPAAAAAVLDSAATGAELPAGTTAIGDPHAAQGAPAPHALPWKRIVPFLVALLRDWLAATPH